MAVSTATLHPPHHAALIRKDTLHSDNVAGCCKPQHVFHVFHTLFDDTDPLVNIEAPCICCTLACSAAALRHVNAEQQGASCRVFRQR